MLAKLKEHKNKSLCALQEFRNEQKCSIPYKYLNMTIREIVRLFLWLCSTLGYRHFIYFQIDPVSVETTGSVHCISKEDLLNITKSVKKDGKPVKRSASFVDDEGKFITRLLKFCLIDHAFLCIPAHDFSRFLQIFHNCRVILAHFHCLVIIFACFKTLVNCGLNIEYHNLVWCALHVQFLFVLP